MNRIKVYCLVEGFSEANLVERMLAPHFGAQGIDLHAPMITTRRDRRAGVVYKGGILTFRHLLNDLSKLGHQWNHEEQVWITTMFDVYALPKDFPERDRAYAARDSEKKVQLLEQALVNEAQKLGIIRFIPYLALHEFETLLLTKIEALGLLFLDKEKQIRSLAKEISAFGNVEDINHTSEGAPSKRIARHLNIYEKYKGSDQSGAINVLEAIGLNHLRKSCPHFHAWLKKIESLNAA